jgi:hypothetical protein
LLLASTINIGGLERSDIKERPMGITKLRLPVVLALVGLAAFINFLEVKANEETDDVVSPAAVWTPDDDDLADIVQACDAAVDYGSCFVDQMSSLAPSEAVSFSQSLFKQGSRAGYLKNLREAGPVDLGTVAYPGAAGFTEGWVLVNGTPAIVNVDDLQSLPQPAMEKDALFKELKDKYPRLRLAVEESERKPDQMPQVLPLGQGRERFVVGYALREPCQTCLAVAHASFGFDFDATGKFMGAKFIKIIPLER